MYILRRETVSCMYHRCIASVNSFLPPFAARLCLRKHHSAFHNALHVPANEKNLSVLAATGICRTTAVASSPGEYV